MDQVTIAAVMTGAGTLIGSLLTLWWTKGVDAAIRLKKADGEEQRALLLAKKETNMIALEAAQAELVKMEERICSLEQCADEIRNHHEVCMEKHRECETRCARLEGRFETLQEQIARLEHHQ